VQIFSKKCLPDVEIGKRHPSCLYRTSKKGTPMTLPITTTYALPLIAVWFVLWMRITKTRSETNASIGDAGNPQLSLMIRQHGNFIEWVPFVLILMILAEAQRVAPLWLHAAGALLLLGRIAHPFGLKLDTAAHPLRYVGNAPNLLAVAILAVALLRLSFGF
jgi:uncharacterized protein